MVIDEAFIGRFKNQIDVLTNLRDTAQGALDRAKDKLVKLNDPGNFGKNIEDVFGPVPSKQGPAAQGGRGKDHK
jgi:hypothetical protein